MRISVQSHLSILMLVELALGKNQVISTRELADRQRISAKYAEQILRPLKGFGYLESRRGPKGGYILVVDPYEIPLSQLITLTEGDLHLVEPPTSSKKVETVLHQQVWSGIEQMLQILLESHTIGQLASIVRSATDPIVTTTLP